MFFKTPPKKNFWRRKTFVFLVSFLTVQKRPIEWLVQTLLVRHFPRRARLSGVMTQSGFFPWLPARNSGFFHWKQQASCRDLQKRSWYLFSFISLTLTTLPMKKLKKNPWIQGRKKFRDFDLRSSTKSQRTDSSWCVCERWTVMPSEVECVCCKELSFLS